jgi:hypothetical protein
MTLWELICQRVVTIRENTLLYVKLPRISFLGFVTIGT